MNFEKYQNATTTVFVRNQLFTSQNALNLSVEEGSSLQGIKCEQLRVQKGNACDLLRSSLNEAYTSLIHAHKEPLLLGSDQCLSISHSQNRVAVAVSEGSKRVGIDIEERSRADLSFITTFALNTFEQKTTALIQNHFSCDQNTLQLIYWTLKEASQKCMRYFPSMEEISILFFQGEIKIFCGNKIMNGQVWISNDYVLSLAEET